MTSPELRRTIDALWRMESPRLIASLTRMLRDVGLAEELAQDALVAALEHWPRQGVPDNPGAWLMTTAQRRAIDLLRQRRLHAGKHEAMAQEPDDQGSVVRDHEREVEDDIGDDLLRLVFATCHPLLPTDARVALTLRLLGGLATDEIARAFLVPEAANAQRIVRVLADDLK